MTDDATPDGSDTPDDDRALTPRERRFVEEYCANGFRGADAARAAGYTGKNVKITAYQLQQKPHVKAAIDAHLDALADNANLRAGAILQEVARLAYSDIRDFITWDGATIVMTDSASLDPELSRCIEEISETREGLKIKLHDKKGSLELLGKYRKLWTDKVEHGVGGSLEEMLRTVEDDDDAGDSA